jgi:hypothetical protein
MASNDPKAKEFARNKLAARIRPRWSAICAPISPERGR